MCGGKGLFAITPIDRRRYTSAQRSQQRVCDISQQLTTETLISGNPPQQSIQELIQARLCCSQAWVLSLPADEHRTNPRTIDFGTGQAQSGNRSPGHASKAPWQASEESIRYRGCPCENRCEAQRTQSRQAQSPIRADESLLGETEEARGEGLVFGCLDITLCAKCLDSMSRGQRRSGGRAWRGWLPRPNSKLHDPSGSL